MTTFTLSEFKKLLEDNKPINNTFNIDEVIPFIDINKETQRLMPSFLITSNDLEVIISQNGSGVISADFAPASLNYKNLQDSTNAYIKNSNINSYISNINKSMKSAFVSGDAIFPDNKTFFGIIDAVEKQKSIPFLDMLDEHVSSLSSVLLQESQKKKNSTSSQKEKTPQKMVKGQVSEEDYKSFCKKRADEVNKTLDSFWRKLQFDKKNPIQREIVEQYGEGQSPFLIGAAGIGKSYNPESIALQNKIPFHIIKFHSGTDSVELIGKTSFRSNFVTGLQEMYYELGYLSAAFKNAHDNAYNNNEGTIILLDEMLRADDMSPLIANLSINNNGEYTLNCEDTIPIVKLKTKDNEELWFSVSIDLDANKQSYTLDDDYNIVIDKDSSLLLKYSGTEKQVGERHSRGDLLSLHSEDFKELIKHNKKAILKTSSTHTSIYTPSSAVALTFTSNVGQDYAINMSESENLDPALKSRMKPLFVSPLEIPVMVDLAISKVSSLKNWSKKDIKKIIEIMTVFSNSVTETFKHNTSLGNPESVNSRTLEGIIKGIDSDEPFGDNPWSVENILHRADVKFLPVDTSLSIEEMRENPILNVVQTAAEIAIDNSKSLNKKRNISGSLKQSSPASEEVKKTLSEDEEPSASFRL